MLLSAFEIPELSGLGVFDTTLAALELAVTQYDFFLGGISSPSLSASVSESLADDSRVPALNP